MRRYSNDNKEDKEKIMNRKRKCILIKINSII